MSVISACIKVMYSPKEIIIPLPLLRICTPAHVSSSFFGSIWVPDVSIPGQLLCAGLPVFPTGKTDLILFFRGKVPGTPSDLSNVLLGVITKHIGQWIRQTILFKVLKNFIKNYLQRNYYKLIIYETKLPSINYSVLSPTWQIFMKALFNTKKHYQCFIIIYINIYNNIFNY